MTHLNTAMKRAKMRLLIKLFIWWLNNDGARVRGTTHQDFILKALLNKLYVHTRLHKMDKYRG